MNNGPQNAELVDLIYDTVTPGAENISWVYHFLLGIIQPRFSAKPRFLDWNRESRRRALGMSSLSNMIGMYMYLQDMGC